MGVGAAAAVGFECRLEACKAGGETSSFPPAPQNAAQTERGLCTRGDSPAKAGRQGVGGKAVLRAWFPFGCGYRERWRMAF